MSARRPVWLYPSVQRPTEVPNGTIPSASEAIIWPLPWPLFGSSDTPLADDRLYPLGQAGGELLLLPYDLLGSSDAPLQESVIPEAGQSPDQANHFLDLLPHALLGSSDTPLADDSLYPPGQAGVDPGLLPFALLGSSDTPLLDETATLLGQSESRLELLPAELLGSIDMPSAPANLRQPEFLEPLQPTLPHRLLATSEDIFLRHAPPGAAAPLTPNFSHVPLHFIIPVLLGETAGPHATGAWVSPMNVRARSSIAASRAHVEAMET